MAWILNLYSQILSYSKPRWLHPRLVKLNTTISPLTPWSPPPASHCRPSTGTRAAPRRTSADLKEGKRAKFGRRRITLAGKKSYRGRQNAEIGSGAVWERKSIASPGWEGWDTISKETRAPRGHVRWVCVLRKLGILNPKKDISHLMSPQMQLGGLWDEDEGGKEAVPIALGGGVGWAGHGAWLDVRKSNPSQRTGDGSSFKWPDKGICAK